MGGTIDLERLTLGDLEQLAEERVEPLWHGYSAVALGYPAIVLTVDLPVLRRAAA